MLHVLLQLQHMFADKCLKSTHSVEGSSMHRFQPLAVVLAAFSLCIAISLACSKGGGGRNSGSGDAKPKVSPSGSPTGNPCLAFKLADGTPTTDDGSSASPNAQDPMLSPGPDASPSLSPSGSPIPQTSAQAQVGTSGDCTSGWPSVSPTPVGPVGPPVPVPTGGPGSGGTFDPGPGLAQCNSQGKAWVAVADGSKPSYCGEPLVDWCCNEQEVYQRFPLAKAQLEQKFGPLVKDQLKLYNCALENGRYVFYFFIANNTGYHSAWVDLTGAAANAGAIGQCPRLTADDLGIGGLQTSTSTGGTTGSTTLPASIGELTSTSKPQVLQFLQSRAYAGWSRLSATPVAGAQHGSLLEYYNPTMSQSIGPGRGANFVAAPGAIVVLERYNGSNLIGWSLMAKVAQASEKASWFFYEVANSQPGQASEPTAYGLSVDACATCHAGGFDFLK